MFVKILANLLIVLIIAVLLTTVFGYKGIKDKRHWITILLTVISFFMGYISIR